jgi:hypothetical protein
VNIYYQNIISSTLSFLSIFICFNLVISFWGRKVLKLINIKNNINYGNSLPIAAGLLLIVILGYIYISLINISEYFKIYYSIIFYVGFICLLFEVIKNFVKILKNQGNKLNYILILIKSHKNLFTASIFSIIFAICYSAMWPSGKISVWLYGSEDYFNWALSCDYYLNNFNYNIINISHQFINASIDSFGTHMVFSFFTIVTGKSAFYSVSYFLLVLVIICGTIIRCLVEKIFQLNFWVSFLVAFGVIAGPFFNYLIFRGQVGELVALPAFLIALEVLFNLSKLSKPGSKDLITLFFPIFLLFLSYQGGFLVFSFVILLVSFFLQIISNFNKSIFICLRQAFLKGPLLVLGLITLSFLMAPFTFYLFFNRVIFLAKYEGGWTNPLLHPWLLSGLPIFKINYFSTFSPISPFFWVLFLVLVMYLGFLASKKDLLLKPTISPICHFNWKSVLSDFNDNPAIFAITITFLCCLLMYLATFLFIGNEYRTWKLASYTALPLSFVPTSLLAKIFSRRWSDNGRYYKICFFLALSFFLCWRFYDFLPLTQGVKILYHNVSPVDDLLSTLNKIIKNQPQGTTFLLFQNDSSLIYTSIELFKKQNTNKVKLMNKKIFFEHIYDYSNIIKGNKYLIISDKEYSDILNDGQHESDFKKLYTFNNIWIKEHGYIVYLHINNLRKTNVDSDWLTLNVFLPTKSIGSSFRFCITLGPVAKNEWTCGSKVKLIYHNHGNSIIKEIDYDKIDENIPSFLTKNGVLQVSLKFPNKCSFEVKKVEIK